MSSPLVSVIMGVYNCTKVNLLEKSINSIINQTYTNWELIICNDGSTNDTLAILQSMADIDNRIHILSYKQNVGLHFALNTCIKEARGKYLARQDDDDISEPARFEKQVNFLEYNMAFDIVGTTAKIYNDEGIWGEFGVPEYPSKKDFLWNSPFIHPSTMIRLDSMKKVGGYRVAKETRRCEDYDLFMRMYAMGMKGYNIQTPLYQYRMINDPNKTYRPLKYRFDEMKVRAIGYKKLWGPLPYITTFPYIIKPIIVGLIPSQIFSKIRKRQY